MILTGPEIRRQVGLGRITIRPFNENQLNPNSYNYRLGPKLILLSNKVLNPKKTLWLKRIKIPKTGYVLKPGRVYLGHTIEQIGSDFFATSLIGRSTIGRLGLWLQVTADLGHIGTNCKWTLEMKVVEPLKIYPGMRIGQVTFWKVRGDISRKYRGKYAFDSDPVASLIKRELI